MIFKKQWFLIMMLCILVGTYIPAPYSVEAAENTNSCGNPNRGFDIAIL